MEVTAADRLGELFPPELLRRLETLRLVTKQRFSGRSAGERLSRRRGVSVEFAEHRNYSPGDDLKYLDWNILSRLDRPFLKTFYEEEDLLVTLVVDTSGSMGFGQPAKLDRAVQLAGGLAYLGLANLDRVRLYTAAGTLEPGSRSLRGKGSIHSLLRTLVALESGGETRLAQGMKELSHQVSSKGVVVVISDLMDPDGLREGLVAVRSRGSAVTVIHVMSPQELEPELKGDLRLVDSESGEEVEVSVSPRLLARYRITRDRFLSAVKAECLGQGAGYLMVPTSTPVEEGLLRFVGQRI